MTAIVFSKDRALQLDAFLRSYRQHVSPLNPVHVIYLATSSRHMQAYEYVFYNRRSWVMPVAQRSFQADVLELLPKEGCVTFFVDDQVFTDAWDAIERPGLSLRLGLNLTRNYASNDALQALPPHQIVDGFVTWRWSEGEMAWRYPLSLDGHAFSVVELRQMLDGLSFHSPNTMESELQRYLPRFLERNGTCYPASKVVNVPWNRVQTDWENRSAGLSAETMLGYWEQGFKIDLSAIGSNESVHQEFQLRLVPR